MIKMILLKVGIMDNNKLGTLNPDYFNTDSSHLSMVKKINSLIDIVNKQQKEIKKLKKESKKVDRKIHDEFESRDLGFK
jgi:hypothetical protein